MGTKLDREVVPKIQRVYEDKSGIWSYIIPWWARNAEASVATCQHVVDPAGKTKKKSWYSRIVVSCVVSWPPCCEAVPVKMPTNYVGEGRAVAGQRKAHAARRMREGRTLPISSPLAQMPPVWSKNAETAAGRAP